MTRRLAVKIGSALLITNDGQLRQTGWKRWPPM